MGALVTRLLVLATALLIVGACDAALPGATTGDPNDLSEAVRFRQEFGLRADEPWVMAVASNPLASGREFGVPLLPDEVADLEARARDARRVVPVVRDYAAAHSDSFAGLYLDQLHRGRVVALFTRDTGTHDAALKARLHPGADLEVGRARYTLQALEDLHDRVDSERDWFGTLGARLGSMEVDIPGNVLRMGVSVADRDTLARITARFDAHGMASFWIDDDLSQLPRGHLRGRVIDRDGRPLAIADLAVEAVGDLGDYEPDGGVGYATRPDGTFDIPRLAAMGWEVRIVEVTPSERRVRGRHHVEVSPGLTTFVEIVIDP